MKNTIICFIISTLFSTFAFSEEPTSDLQKVRNILEAQIQIKDSELNKSIQSLVTLNKIPATSEFTLYGSDFLQIGNKQSLNECQQENCIAYERNFFRQISEIRWTRQGGPGSEIRIWGVRIYVYVFRVWKSDSEGNHLELLKEETRVSNVTIF